MSLLTRTVASTVIFVTFGLASLSAPGLAYDINRPAITTPALTAPQTAPLAAVPVGQPAQTQADAIPDPSTFDDGYDSLAEAVADQTLPDRVDGDLRCLANAIYFEAKGEPLSGQLAVAKVILNRTQSGRFPKSVCSVVMQSGQFSFVRGGVLPQAPETCRAFHTAVAIAQVAMDDDWDSAAGDALYFHARRVSPGWRMTKVASIGNHVFYR
jgi:spore germination cell wall hydrolase CwlJ-like protein